MSRHSYNYLVSTFEPALFEAGGEIVAIRDPDVNMDQDFAQSGGGDQNPAVSETTGSLQGDRRRWVKEHGGATGGDTEGEMLVQVVGIDYGNGPVSDWLSCEDAMAYVIEGRAARKLATEQKDVTG